MLFAVVAVGLLVGALVFYVGNGVVAARQNSGNRLSALRTRDEVLDGSFSERALAPMVQGIGRTVIRFTPTGWVGNAQHKLILAAGLIAWTATRGRRCGSSPLSPRSSCGCCSNHWSTARRCGSSSSACVRSSDSSVRLRCSTAASTSGARLWRRNSPTSSTCS